MAATASRPPDRWLLLIHQIPPTPNYLRVKIGRRLQRLGAVAIKNSVYCLPSSDQAQEDLQWVLREIVESGGDGSICESRFVDGLSDAQVEELFNAARDPEYAMILKEARASVENDAAGTDTKAFVARLRRRLAILQAIDFFGARGRAAAEGAIAEVERRAQSAGAAGSANDAEPKTSEFDLSGGRVWVTRRGIHIDRMASAWLIRRFIDPQSRFKFVGARGYEPEPGELRFDMFEAEFTHSAECCTFEVLLSEFSIDDPALRPIAEIVHDIDLKETRFERPETSGVDSLIAGIAMGNKSDEDRLAQGKAVFDGLYEYFRRKS